MYTSLNMLLRFVFLNVVYICCIHRLRAGADGTMLPCGFTEPSDASAEDTLLWMPTRADHHTLNVDEATYLVKLVSDVFASIVRQELHAVSWNGLGGMLFLSDFDSFILIFNNWNVRRTVFVICLF